MKEFIIRAPRCDWEQGNTMSSKPVVITEHEYEALEWHITPRDQGQIVTYAYAVDGPNIYCLRTDGDKSRSLEIGDITDSEELFEPQNGSIPDVVMEPCLVSPFVIHLHDDGGADHSTEIDDLPDDDDCESEARDWVTRGDWGSDGAVVDVSWSVIDDLGQDADIDGSCRVNVEPDHDDLIRAAGGDTDCEHDWTSDGEGGCTENPGVWSVGGTAMIFKTHCRECGLHRTERHTGPQRNPGEHDTVEYEQPDSWRAEK